MPLFLLMFLFLGIQGSHMDNFHGGKRKRSKSKKTSVMGMTLIHAFQNMNLENKLARQRWSSGESLMSDRVEPCEESVTTASVVSF